MNQELLNEALRLESVLGWHIIPIGKDKKPMIKWMEYQQKRPTIDQLKEWFTNPQVVGMAVITGRASGVIALDFDIKHGRTSKEFFIPPTVCARSGGGGEHFFFKYPGYEVKNTAGALFGEGVDIRGDGGYIVLSPSLHSSGKKYEWLVSPTATEDLNDAPAWLLEKLRDDNHIKDTDWAALTTSIVGEGSRNWTHTKLIGKILHDLSPELWEACGWPAIRAWNAAHAEPPTPEKELRATWESLKEKQSLKPENKEERENVSDKILRIILTDPSVELFHDQYNDSYIRLLVNGHYEIWPCKSSKLMNLLSKKFWEQNKKAASGENLKSAVAVLQGLACFDGKEYQLANRVTWSGADLWYDMSDKDWRSVKITEEGWELITDSPIAFKRYQHQKAQVTPVATGGDIKKLLPFLNIKSEDQKLLLQVFLVSCFIPDIAHVMPVIHGPQGAAKTMLSMTFRRIPDPSVIGVMGGIPKSMEELQQLVSHHWFCFFDNVSFVGDDVSDFLCKVITGSGFSKRELYTNDEDVIREMRRVIGVNGINLVTTRPDLLQRSLLFQLEPIPESERKQGKVVMKELEEALPFILGGIFDILSKAMKIYRNNTYTDLPRMADFSAWGCAISEAMGYGADRFIQAYKQNINDQNEEVLQDPVAVSIKELLESKQGKWEGSATELLNELDFIIEHQGRPIERDKTWPKAANKLVQRMNILRMNLLADGISYTNGKDASGRTLTLVKSSTIKNGDGGTIKTIEKIPTPQTLL